MTVHILNRKFSSARPDGTLIITDFEFGESQKDTVMCCHCNKHWVLGTFLTETLAGDMGFCRKCNHPCCPQCQDECVPIERRLDIMGGHENPTAVRAGGKWDGSIWVPE